MFNFLEKINPFNWLENFVIKRIVKKITKGFPTLKTKGVDFFETHKEEIIQKVKVTIFEFIQKHKDK